LGWLGPGAFSRRGALGPLCDLHPSVETFRQLGTIIVTMPGTSYSISYRKLHDTPWLVTTDIRDDPDSPISKHTFRARAWTAANDRARELGWIV
jgi:hypothetical protein